jgi:signal peptidase complex subunit 1
LESFKNREIRQAHLIFFLSGQLLTSETNFTINPFRFIITLFGIVGFVWGAIIQQFSQTVYILFAGFALSAILTIPPWPIYRKKPLNWQKSKNQDSEKKSKKN